MIQLYCCTDVNIKPDELKRLLTRLPADEVAVFTSRLEPLRQVSVLASCFVRFKLCERLGIRNTELALVRDARGKPAAANRSGIYFSVSHTRGSFLTGLSEHEIGVDIEGNRRPNAKIISRFFTGAEADYIGHGQDNWESRFFRVWTRKEAYAKWDGRGISLPMQSFDTVNGNIARLLWSREIAPCHIACCGIGEGEPEVIFLRCNDVVEKALCLDEPGGRYNPA